MLTVRSGFETNLSIRFNKIYSNEKQIEKIVFEDIILDKEKYQEEKENKNEITNEINNDEENIKMKMTINLLK